MGYFIARGNAPTISSGTILQLKSLERAVVWVPRKFVQCYFVIERQWTDGRNYFWPLVIISVGYCLLLSISYHLLGDVLEPFKTKLKIENWGDRRSLGFAIAGVTGPWLAVVGYFLSARRTQSMQEDNRINLVRLDHERFSKAVELLDGGAPAAVAALTVIAEVGFLNGTLNESARRVLVTYLRLNARMQGQEKRPTHYGSSRHLEVAFSSLCDIQNSAHLRQVEFGPGYNIKLSNLDFSELDLSTISRIKNFRFENYNLADADLSNSSFSGVMFAGCDLTGCNLHMSKFIAQPNWWDCIIADCDMSHANITGTDFIGLWQLERGQLTHCRYARHYPPLGLPTKSVERVFNMYSPESFVTFEAAPLPTPWRFEDLSERRYFTLKEAEDFWSGQRGDLYRPRDREGNLIKIVYPDKSEDLSTDD